MDYPGGLEKSCIWIPILRIGKSFEFQMSPGLWKSIKLMCIYLLASIGKQMACLVYMICYGNLAICTGRSLTNL